jgi:hypothetical protein
MQKINKKIYIVISSLCLLPFAFVAFAFLFTYAYRLPSLRFDPETIVHKTMNYDEYDIVVLSNADLSRITGERKLYANIWSNRKRIHNYYITRLDAADEYGLRIKDIAVLPDTRELMVEFTPDGYSKSGTRIDLYKIGEDSGD